MKNVLVVNRKATNCGVHQYGINIFESLKKSQKNKYFYIETNDYITLQEFISKNKIDKIVFNYISWVMGWITKDLIEELSKKHECYLIYHDGPIPSFKIKSLLYCDPTKIVNNLNEFNIKRCLFDYKTNIKKMTDKTIISSFGFGFPDKGFHKIISRINEEFNNSIIRLHMPNADVDHNNQLKNHTLKLCSNIISNGNQLIITDEYMSNEKLLDWLSESTINCFFYDKKPSKGISSVIDYALSVDVPIATTNCDMMRHIISDKISIEKNKITDIISFGCDHLKKFKEEWSPKKFVENFDLIINK